MATPQTVKKVCVKGSLRCKRWGLCHINYVLIQLSMVGSILYTSTYSVPHYNQCSLSHLLEFDDVLWEDWDTVALGSLLFHQLNQHTPCFIFVNNM